MRYSGKIIKGTFRKRTGRFTAICNVNGSDVACHVRNTGRLEDLLLPGGDVFLLEAGNRERKTPFDIIAVTKGNHTVNIDSSVPNTVAEEYIRTLYPPDHLIKREVKTENSRFDLAVSSPEGHVTYIEVKGCTKEKEGICSFPDAPSKRALKHVNELSSLSLTGYGAVIIFVVQMEGMKYFTPDDGIMPEFRSALRNALRCGVKILVLSASVAPESVTASGTIPAVI